MPHYYVEERQEAVSEDEFIRQNLAYPRAKDGRYVIHPKFGLVDRKYLREMYLDATRHGDRGLHGTAYQQAKSFLATVYYVMWEGYDQAGPYYSPEDAERAARKMSEED